MDLGCRTDILPRSDHLSSGSHETPTGHVLVQSTIPLGVWGRGMANKNAQRDSGLDQTIARGGPLTARAHMTRFVQNVGPAAQTHGFRSSGEKRVYIE